MSRRVIAICIFIVTVAGLMAGVWWLAFTSQIENLARRGEADLSLAEDRLTGQLQRVRELAVLLADHPELAARVAGAGSGTGAGRFLRQTADKTGTRDILLVDQNGALLAASSPRAFISPDAPHVLRALQGALGAHHSTEPGSGARRFTYAAPIFGVDGPVTGVVVVRADVERIESDWRADPQAVFFSDARGVIFTANRSELLFQERPENAVPGDLSADYEGVRLKPFVSYTQSRVAGFDVWRLDGGPYLPARALHLSHPLPLIQMTGEALVDIAPAFRLAGLQAAASGAVCLFFGAALLLLADRRRALADLLETEARANAVLETRVAERTRALSDANTALRREVGEREEAEAALTRAQADLVQAGKLSALGQMSAGISHELNQPLMAIRSFAENAQAFLERGKIDVTSQNLSRITEMAHRMGRIIKNLRAFSKQETAPLGRVDVGVVLASALELMEARLNRDGIVVTYIPSREPLIARGGEVRLGQVFINLISNAADAMEGHDVRKLDITTTETAQGIQVGFRDTGSGIVDPDRIFDPFYSTKEVGSSEGMGLGLSISYGIVQSFGGDIRGTNAEGGGARFTVTLEAWQVEEAA